MASYYDRDGFCICDDANKMEEPARHTKTYKQQSRVEDAVETAFHKWLMGNIEFHREKHKAFVLKHLRVLDSAYADSSRSWYLYWLLHCFDLVDISVDDELLFAVHRFLKSLKNKDGGYGGAPAQSSHIATTYATIMAIVCLDLEEAKFSQIDRCGLFCYYMSMKKLDGSFMMHYDGEADVRSAYCVVAVTKILNMDTKELFENTAEWIAKCRTYEGGYAGEPGCEAHGGYTYCALAALVLLNRTDLIDAERTARWVVKRQMAYEGGFQGRVNKLVDSCYSFWLAASAEILRKILAEQDNVEMPPHGIFNGHALQTYVLGICQNFSKGGLIDKPGKAPDVYHTTYALAGASIGQHAEKAPAEQRVGGIDADIPEINVLLNLIEVRAEVAFEYFRQRPFIPGKGAYGPRTP